MACSRRRQHWIFIDSRGSDLYEKIQHKQCSEYIRVWKQGGSTLDYLTQLAKFHLKSYPFDVIYLAGEVNDITTKNKATGKISFGWNPPEKLILHLVDEPKRVDMELAKEFPASKIVFCTLVGSHLERVVTGHPTTLLQQEAVNEAVFSFNGEVFKINERRDTFSPSLHKTFHRSKKGRKNSHYDNLADGIHLNDYMKDKWTEEFHKAALRN